MSETEGGIRVHICQATIDFSFETHKSKRRGWHACASSPSRLLFGSSDFDFKTEQEAIDSLKRRLEREGFKFTDV